MYLIDQTDLLVSKHAYTRVWNGDGYCPLHVAIMMKNLDLVRILCRSETDANLRTQDGYTPYMLCCSNGCYECADFIISRGGDPYLLSNNRQTCLSV